MLICSNHGIVAVENSARATNAFNNSAPAIVIYNGDQLEGVFLVEVIDGKITNFYAMRNPDKLAGITIPREITREV